MADLREYPTRRMLGALGLVLIIGSVLYVLDSRELIWTRTYCTICGTVKDTKTQKWPLDVRFDEETTYHDALELEFDHQHAWVEPPVHVMESRRDSTREAVVEAIIREKVERLWVAGDLARIQASIAEFDRPRQRQVWEFALDPSRPFPWSALTIFELDRPRPERWALWEAFTERYKCEGITEIRCYLEPSRTLLRVTTPDKQTYKSIDWSQWRP